MNRYGCYAEIAWGGKIRFKNRFPNRYEYKRFTVYSFRFRLNIEKGERGERTCAMEQDPGK